MIVSNKIIIIDSIHSFNMSSLDNNEWKDGMRERIVLRKFNYIRDVNIEYYGKPTYIYLLSLFLFYMSLLIIFMI